MTTWTKARLLPIATLLLAVAVAGQAAAQTGIARQAASSKTAASRGSNCPTSRGS